ncbi:preprotein translocase subunit SecA [Symmachiella dynata]|uniref:preprotein translocase subunit SecA n=1 Tax=Symmachiella dynata TaxID=2527995 RepID=UPI00118B05E0|nr:preprotein translocase subunit SecA [Symmachiella dynata]QDT48068.1 preprotein translocase subunit SecA [Symmachiella dynata]
MGLWDMLFGGGYPASVDVSGDHIWMSHAAKFHGIGRQLTETGDSAGVLLIAHFDETLAQLNAITAVDHYDVPVHAILAQDLSTDIAIRWRMEQTATIDLIVADRHPLWSVDGELLQFAGELPCRCRVAYHQSLQDPLVKRFTGAWLEPMLEQMGMKQDEAISSPLVSKRIKAMQKRIEAKAFGNHRAASAAEWFELNFPES